MASTSDTARFKKVYDLASNPGCLLESANSNPYKLYPFN